MTRSAAAWPTGHFMGSGLAIKHCGVSEELQTSFTRDQGIIVGEGMVCDFSPGGCRIRSFTPPLPGSDVELCIYPDDSSGGLVIQLAKVCWVRDYEFGVAFVAIDPEVTQQLASLWSVLKPSESRAKAS
ncbi:MAG: PilZ domain-containing protein [Nitrospira sp.]|nr:PilZ domain-containing protein [Nitrospira sp.]